MNLYEKIQAVTQEVTHVAKNMTVGEGKNQYKAVSDYDVITVVRKAEAKHRVLSMAIDQDIINTRQEDIENKWGVKHYQVHDIKMKTRIFDIDNPDDYVDICTLATAWDTADKGLGKSSTYARKYALLNAYKIPTGEDPDKDKSTEGSKPKYKEPAPTAPFSYKDKLTDVDTAVAERNKLVEYVKKGMDALGVTQKTLEAYKAKRVEELSDAHLQAVKKRLDEKASE